MATDQSDDRCEQIAREITSGPCGSYIFSDGVLRLRKEIATALQAAEQRGREEAKRVASSLSLK